ncbi:putative outer membrane protein [Yersinia pestis 1522]|nr:putative outer membrane protein [Yersinia pestis Pestoides F]AJK26238.1 putative outer membrane protein [Yersinia pestis Pestoides G]AKS57369.1 putative outer membrane protein [Yersinia pestis 1412]AKS62581.1 outer membrane lipoprotein, Slp family [Yersinia pestis 2944]AKS75679.1 putative outer membrane protein [Yersinia pestis 1413]AKS83115.1 putative outer membrane protein [Yersinia pestis 1522]AKS88940.1 outer membrane lipoprotein, Slp family [Yersinia pestis 8787]AKS92059.1 outer memb
MAMNTSMTQSKKFRNHKWMYGWLGLGALLLSGCVTIPPAIQGTTATPLQDLNQISSKAIYWSGSALWRYGCQR